jgi:3-deoxy-D-manno-octulosonic-acid transferase
MEALRERDPDVVIVLTFFSPSGYEVRKNDPRADHVFYLPADSPANARKFFDIIGPSSVFFVKYEFWFYYFREAALRGIPLYVVSAIFRKDQIFFKPYGRLFRSMLKNAAHVFVQDENSLNLLIGIRVSHVTKAGDTRFDRVLKTAEGAELPACVGMFCGNDRVVVAGSTWPDDEKIIKAAVARFPDIKWIIAPHEVSANRVNDLKSEFQGFVTFSEAENHTLESCRGMIIDNVGMLSSLYKAGTMAYVGGGFGKGIHNILEAAVYGMPVIFGTNYRKFAEAVDLVSLQAAFCIRNPEGLCHVIGTLLHEQGKREEISGLAEAYVRKQAGATAAILNVIGSQSL